MYLFSINISSQHRNDISNSVLFRIFYILFQRNYKNFQIYIVYPISFIELQKFFREDNK